MRIRIGKNLRTALVFGALAVTLIATVVSGRERPSGEVVEAPSVRAASQRQALAAPPQAEELDLERLHRAEGEEAKPVELFGADVPGVAARAAQGKNGEPPPRPAEPPLPFTYLGKVIDEGKLSVFLTTGATHYSVQQGQTVARDYRVERITEAAITFTYLPTGSHKVLAIPPRN